MRAYVGTLIQVSPIRSSLGSRSCRAHAPPHLEQVLKRYKDRKQARALIREFELTGSIHAGSGYPPGQGVGDSAVSGWTGLDRSQTGELRRSFRAST